MTLIERAVLALSYQAHNRAYTAFRDE